MKLQLQKRSILKNLSTQKANHKTNGKLGCNESSFPAEIMFFFKNPDNKYQKPDRQIGKRHEPTVDRREST